MQLALHVEHVDHVVSDDFDHVRSKLHLERCPTRCPGHTFQQFVLRRLQNVVNTRRPRIDLTTDSSHSSSISDFWQWNWVQDNDAIWKALRELQAGFSWDWREISDEFWQIFFVLWDWKTSFYFTVLSKFNVFLWFRLDVARVLKLVRTFRSLKQWW